MLYVNEAMKLSPCSPTFTDIRDGMIQAATDLFGGEDVCRMWEAFAQFGLGIDAESGGPFSTSPTNGFGVPDACAGDNANPQVNISQPQDGDRFAQGTSVSFVGDAADVEDGDLTSELGWTSSLDGNIGSGGTFATHGAGGGFRWR